MKLLIVEDERSLSRAICEYLKVEGHICEEAHNYHEAIKKTADNTYNCLVLDLGLPDGSGLDIIRELKKNKAADRVLILSARSSLEDKITGLKIGADDYLSKPFHMAELSARINSVCRRDNFNGFNELSFNEIKIRTDAQEVLINDKLLNLTRKEYDLLVFFMINKDRVITKESIVEHLWGDNVILTDSFDFIYTHVKNLRKKLLSYNCGNYIKVIYGFGYKFSEP
jgi:DNA-binding response OmpR family regulator